MAELPTGTVTFLFTDIEGSARLWEQDPEAMDAALSLHNALLRAAIETNGGHVFKMMGDAFCAAFSSPVEAICVSLEIQQALQSQDWGVLGALRVRQALHTGTSQERHGDYFGPTLNRVARLLGVGHGGQILFSQAVWDLVAEHLPRSRNAGWGIKDLGLHRLRDLTQPEHVYQLLHPSLPAEFEPLRSLDSLPNNLPRELSSFIGREEVLGHVSRLLRESRLLTLTGPGGAGKTRLSLQAAAEVLPERLDGVWQVELASLDDGARLPDIVCIQLGLRVDAHHAPMAVLEEYVQRKDMLLILDNCEHLVEAAAHLVERLLKLGPRLTVLTTSRLPLGCSGEVTYAVPSLATPSPIENRAPTNHELELMRRVESVRLFVERATAALPRFELTASNATAVAQICRRLDGIPLALELAAVRIRVLSPHQIAQRLDDRFRLLTGGGTTALPHKQTLRATIDWSYDLLAPVERTLFRRLGVFAGGFALEAAETVCADDTLDSFDVLENLSRLVDRSLVVAESGGSDSEEEDRRYRLLDTLRAYAAERLKENGAEELGLRTRHREYFTGLAEEASPHLEAADCQQWLSRLQLEMPNFRAALAWSVDGEERLRLATALWRYWYQRGPAAEGRAWLEGALARSSGAVPEMRARALSAAGNLAHLQADYKAAFELFQRSYQLRSTEGDRAGIARSLINMGTTARSLGDLDAAEEYLGESLRILRELGDAPRVAAALLNLSNIQLERGNDEAAAAGLEESRLIYTRDGNQWFLAIVYHNLGQVRFRQDRAEESVTLYKRSLSLAHELGAGSILTLGFNGLAVAAFQLGVLERAVEFMAVETGIRESMGAPIPPADIPKREDRLQEMRRKLGGERFQAAREKGAELSIDNAVKDALAWEVGE